jgi:hypothetical protein
VLARQVLECLIHASHHFCSGYFEDKVLLIAHAAWTMILLFYTPCYCWDYRCALHLAIFSLQMGSQKLFCKG